MRLDIEGENHTIELYKIENGKTFKHNGAYYIATDEVTSDTKYRFCVNLSNGLLLKFDYSVRVLPVSLMVTLDPEEGAKNE